MNGDNPFLRLLVEEAPLERFGEPVRQAVRRGAGAEEVERLRAEMLLALQVRATLQERRRREAEEPAGPYRALHGYPLGLGRSLSSSTGSSCSVRGTRYQG